MGAITVSSRNTFDVSGSLINNFGRFICYGYDNIDLVDLVYFMVVVIHVMATVKYMVELQIYVVVTVIYKDRFIMW